MTLKCRLFELLLEECFDPTLRRRGAVLTQALRKQLAATPMEWRSGFLRCATLDAEYHLARVTEHHLSRGGPDATAAALALDAVSCELLWESPERMYEQVTRDDLFAFHRCTVFMYAGAEPGFERVYPASRASPRVGGASTYNAAATCLPCSTNPPK